MKESEGQHTSHVAAAGKFTLVDVERFSCKMDVGGGSVVLRRSPLEWGRVTPVTPAVRFSHTTRGRDRQDGRASVEIGRAGSDMSNLLEETALPCAESYPVDLLPICNMLKRTKLPFTYDVLDVSRDLVLC